MESWKASHSVSYPNSEGITAPARAGSLGAAWAPWGITRFSSSLSMLSVAMVEI